MVSGEPWVEPLVGRPWFPHRLLRISSTAGLLRRFSSFPSGLLSSIHSVVCDYELELTALFSLLFIYPYSRVALHQNCLGQ